MDGVTKTMMDALSSWAFHWLIPLACVLVYGALVEYVGHRWLMHRPLLGRVYWYLDHAIEHHGKGRNDINISISPITALVVTSPVLCIALFCGWQAIIVIPVASLAYAALWTCLHASYHDVGCQWIKGLPGYGRWRTHHLLHHTNPATNFGTVFIFTDRLFGTASFFESGSHRLGH